jgi:hypothetical protein
MEIWKDVIGYEGLYQVSSYGRVMSLDRTIWNKANKSYSKIKGCVLKLDSINKKYEQISLMKNGVGKKFLVHRLVAMHFVENINYLPQVNHIDENKMNNHYLNLEWVTASMNINHGNRNKITSNKLSKSVVRIDNNGNKKIYKSALLAEKEGFSRFCICLCCKGKTKTHKKFKWEYVFN